MLSHLRITPEYFYPFPELKPMWLIFHTLAGSWYIFHNLNKTKKISKHSDSALDSILLAKNCKQRGQDVHNRKSYAMFSLWFLSMMKLVITVQWKLFISSFPHSIWTLYSSSEHLHSYFLFQDSPLIGYFHSFTDLKRTTMSTKQFVVCIPRPTTLLFCSSITCTVRQHYMLPYSRFFFTSNPFRDHPAGPSTY